MTAILTRAVQQELGIIGETIHRSGPCLFFRMDPGNLFERRGSVQDDLTGSYSVVITQRYQPDMPLVDASRSSIDSIAELPGALRAGLAFAAGSEAYVPHWLDRRTVQLPHWSRTYPAVQPGAAPIAAAITQEMAEDTGAVHYLSAAAGLIICSNNAPGCGRFFSATPDGYWSLHQAGRSRPLAEAPDSTALTMVPPRRQAAPAVTTARKLS